MKTNHIPTSERLQRRIEQLELKLDSSWLRFRGNPYRRCIACGKYEPEISISGHGKGCFVKGLINEISHYKELLRSVSRKENYV